MARSCLTEGLRSLQQAQPQAQAAGQGAGARGAAREAPGQRADNFAAAPAGEAPSEVGLEIRAILTQEPGSASWERGGFFGVSPPTRSDNGLVRDRVFGHCILIAPARKPSQQLLQQPRPASVGTA